MHTYMLSKPYLHTCVRVCVWFLIFLLSKDCIEYQNREINLINDLSILYQLQNNGHKIAIQDSCYYLHIDLSLSNSAVEHITEKAKWYSNLNHSYTLIKKDKF